VARCKGVALFDANEEMYADGGCGAERRSTDARWECRLLVGSHPLFRLRRCVQQKKARDAITASPTTTPPMAPAMSATFDPPLSDAGWEPVGEAVAESVEEAEADVEVAVGCVLVSVLVLVAVGALEVTPREVPAWFRQDVSVDWPTTKRSVLPPCRP
jgi:hypothetical protein